MDGSSEDVEKRASDVVDVTVVLVEVTVHTDVSVCVHAH